MAILRFVRRKLRQKSRVIQGYSSAIMSLTPDAKQRFVILSGGRRGSHLLIDLLNSHTDLHVDGAILNAETVPAMAWPRLYLHGRERRHRQETYGFKAAVNQLERQKIDPWSFLAEFTHAGGKIIHLNRSNVLRSVISREIAHTRGRHYDTAANPLQGQKFHIDCSDLLSRLEEKIYQRKTEAGLLRDLDHIAVNYENDLLLPERHQATCDRIFQYLHRPSQPVVTSQTKRSPPDLRDVISNYDEVACIVEQAKLSHLLNDETVHPMPAVTA